LFIESGRNHHPVKVETRAQSASTLHNSPESKTLNS